MYLQNIHHLSEGLKLAKLSNTKFRDKSRYGYIIKDKVLPVRKVSTAVGSHMQIQGTKMLEVQISS